MRKRSTMVIATMFVAVLLTARAQERVADSRIADSVEWKIRQEATDHSQIMHTVHVLTDLYGPRLTGSPNAKAAAEWTIEQMSSWGLKNGHLEAWEFAHPGWMNERLSAHITSPVKGPLVVEAARLDSRHQRPDARRSRADQSCRSARLKRN